MHCDCEGTEQLQKIPIWRSKVGIYEAFKNFYGEGYAETLPHELVEAYEIVECLSCVDGCDTLLLIQKSTEKKMVAKCYT